MYWVLVGLALEVIPALLMISMLSSASESTSLEISVSGVAHMIDEFILQYAVGWSVFRLAV